MRNIGTKKLQRECLFSDLDSCSRRKDSKGDSSFTILFYVCLSEKKIFSV